MTEQPSPGTAPAAILPIFDTGAEPGLTCRFCRNTPAVRATFYQHTGMLLLMKTATVHGPFCRDCGLHSFRSMTGHTMVAGWWGLLSIIATPGLIGINLFQRRKVAKLGPPVIGPARIRPADPGPPLYRRSAMFGLVMLVLIAVAFVAYAVNDRVDNQVGKCVEWTLDGTSANLVGCASKHDGVITQVVDDADECPPDSVGVISRETSRGNRDDGKLLCVGPDAASSGTVGG